MKRGIIAILCILLALCLVPPAMAAGYSVQSSDVDPSGPASPGDRIITNIAIQLTGSGDQTFNAGNEIEIYTDLDDPEYEYTVSINDIEQTRTVSTRYVRISGWELSYPDTNEVAIYITLEGKAPAVSSTGEIEVIRIRELDGNGNIVSAGEYLIEKTVLNPEDIDKVLDVREDELAELRTTIDTIATEGVNVADAEAKYQEAKTAITNAKTSSYTQANEYLAEAGTLIEEADDLAKAAYANKLISDAQTTIDTTNTHITYFVENRTMSDDSRVTSIEKKLSIAETQLSQAKDFRDNGDYYQARLNAEEAALTADEALSSAEDLREEIGDGGFLPDLSGLGTYILIIVAVVIIGAIGYTVYKRHTKWDELG
ncbi:hypothetical protein AZH53_01010 [Methanomicrobiaceae archaeon CYW5]|uniref:hypothetical protein n=1 Tax=Methanovulcanius yangii TaxID=1789227 RepID=UPI0029CA8803|nr:hypothetical protein [Methanovulcanius yangii]MBT8507008.1 hypothetical protein [Methanovulcanius yangii]